MKKTLLNIILITVLIMFSAGCSSNDPVSEADTESPQQAEAAPAPDVSENEPESDVFELATPDPVGEDDILAIYGSGVEGQTNWTLEQLQELKDGYREIVFSTTNNWPSFSHIAGHGVALPYLLEQAGIKNDAETLIFLAPDGYQARVTIGQLYGKQYAYVNHSAENSSNAEEAEPLIAWAWGDSEAVPENLRPFFGQRGPWDVNTAASVKDLYRIEVSTRSTGAWEAPEAGIPSGSAVTAGTGLELTHSNMDNIRIYYTTDGSEPDYGSEVYNKSTSYFQPDLMVPIVIDNNVTIKAFAGGLGKADSAVVTLTYTVS